MGFYNHSECSGYHSLTRAERSPFQYLPLLPAPTNNQLENTNSSYNVSSLRWSLYSFIDIAPERLFAQSSHEGFFNDAIVLLVVPLDATDGLLMQV